MSVHAFAEKRDDPRGRTDGRRQPVVTVAPETVGSRRKRVARLSAVIVGAVFLPTSLLFGASVASWVFFDRIIIDPFFSACCGMASIQLAVIAAIVILHTQEDLPNPFAVASRADYQSALSENRLLEIHVRYGHHFRHSTRRDVTDLLAEIQRLRNLVSKNRFRTIAETHQDEERMPEPCERQYG